MTTEVGDDPKLSDAEAAFLAEVRETYHDYPSHQVPSVPVPRGRKWAALPASAAAAAVVAAVAGGGYLVSRGEAPSEQPVAQGPTSSNGASVVPDPNPNAAPDRILVPGLAAAWTQQSRDSCSSYEPGESPEVVYVPRITAECFVQVPVGSTVIFSSLEADQLGGVDWAAASEPWTTIGGVQVLRKVRGEEFTISSRYIMGIWTDKPREYAVYVGDEIAVSAMEALTPEREVRTPDGASE